MFLDFDDRRPEIPRVPSAFSGRTRAIVSVIFHAGLFAFVFFGPTWLIAPPVEASDPVNGPEPVRFVEVAPLREMFRRPRRPAVQSDADRQSMTRERAPMPENEEAYSRGNTPEPIAGGRAEQAAGQQTPEPPQPEPSSELPSSSSAYVPVPQPAQPASQVSRGNLGQTLRDLQQYLREQNFDNQRGGQTDFGSDVQFDSMGVDFGPWLRRFKNQIELNWLVPQAAELLKGRVVIQFYVQRNGAITDLRVVEPATIPAFTTAAVNALKLSNPTSALPREYPADRVLFTVTFHYNDRSR